MTSENEPARPTDPPPAPLVACAERSFLAAAGISAMTDSPVDDTMPSTRASLVMFASVIATPAPMPSEPPVEAWPSAVEDAAAASRARSVRIPPLVIVTPAGTAARELAFASVTATAAATLIGPVEVDAAGVAPLALEPSPVAAVEAPSACARSLLTCPVTPPDGAPVWPSPGAPAAEAVADEEVVDGPRASNVTAPPAVMLRAVVASAVWSANVSATAAPIAALPLLVVLPDAVVLAVAVVVALKATVPPAVSVGPVPADASLRTFEIATATAAATATPPLAPVRASVVAVCVPLAVSVASPAVASVAPFSTRARVSCVTRFRATEAPRPNDVPPVVPGSARAVEVPAEVAVSAAFPLLVVALPPTVALVTILPATSASEPATPTLPPPAPEVACAERSWLDAPAALSVSALEVVVPSIRDSFVTFASVIATPTPTFAVPPLVAVPLAVDEASAASLDVSVSAAPLETDAPLWMLATLDAFATVIATAAATLTLPPLVDADGVALLVEASPPL